MKRDSFRSAGVPPASCAHLRAGCPRSLRSQRGVTLIDFMVGMAVGIIVILAATASLLVVRESSRTMNDSAALEQQATLAMQQISRQISQSSAINAYLSSSGSPDSTATTTGGDPYVTFDTRPIGVAMNTPSGYTPSMNLSNVAVFGVDGDATTSDTLAISYAAPNDGSIAGSCTGGGSGALTNGAPRLISTFYVDNPTQSLVCFGGFPVVTGAVGSGPLVTTAGNVVEMRVNYLAVDGTGNVTYYPRASNVGTNWNTINAVRVCLELVGDVTQSGDRTFTDCNGNPRTTTDKRMHRVIRNTFFLRNPQT